MARNILAFTLAAVFVSSAGWAEPTARDVLFRRALENASTAPSYVLITLISADGHGRRDVCVPAPFLLGAIHREYHLGYDGAGQKKAMDIALSQVDRIFRFHDPEAIQNVQPRYTEALLKEMHEKLAPLSRSELLAGFSGKDGALHSLYDRSRGARYMARRDAIAHVLAERDLLPGHGDIVGVLTVNE